MRIIIVMGMLVLSLMGASKIQMPVSTYQASGSVTDMVIYDKKLYVATDASGVDIFDLKSHKLLQRIKVAQITDFMGDIIDAKIYAVDVMNAQVLLLAEGKQGYRQLYLHHQGKTELLISNDDHLTIAKAKFLNDSTIMLALLSDEVISFDIAAKKENWRVQVSGSKFSNFVLNEDKTQIVVADESGDLQILETQNGKHLKTLSGQNLDNVFQVDYKKDIIATAGQDRRCVVYDLKSGSAYYKSSHFLIYSVGLSPSADRAAYSSDENNNVTVFNTHTKENIGVYGQNKMTLSAIVFINENEFLVSTDATVINRYKIK